MRNSDIRQRSTSRVTANWPRAKFDDEDLVLIRRSLSTPSSIEKGASSTGIADHLLQGSADDRKIRIVLDGEYDVRAAFNDGRLRKKAELSPHLFFRSLAPQNHFQAVEFLRKFGPLEISKDGWLRFRDFWRKHALFTAVCGLWEARNDAYKLREAWTKFFQRRDDIVAADPGEFADYNISWSDWARIPERGSTNEEDLTPDDRTESLGLPWNQSQQQFDLWLAKRSYKIQRAVAVSLVRRLLDAHAEARIERWQYVSNGSHDHFRPVISEDSLWASIWEFFGLDTADGLGPRVCPHCGKLFYPKRGDRVYCTKRLQSLASKREWARKHRSKGKGGRLL